MAHQLVSDKDLNRFNVPDLGEMRKAGSAGEVMKKIVRGEEVGAQLHSIMIIQMACQRYVASLLIADDPQAYAAFQKRSPHRCAEAFA